MFQTLQPQSIRLNKTLFPGARRKLYANNFSQRPHTGPHTVNIQSKFSTIHPLSGNHFVTLDFAQMQLRESFHKQLSPYLKEKIRNSLSQNSQRKYLQGGNRSVKGVQNPQLNFKEDRKIKDLKFFNETIESVKLSQPMNIREIKMGVFLRKSPRVEKESASEMICSSLIINTKQKLSRLVSLKRQQQEEFMELKRQIRNRCRNRHNLKEVHQRRKSMIEPKSVYKLPLMEDETWDRQWKQDITKQTIRYRNRLFDKHKKDMSMKINI